MPPVHAPNVVPPRSAKCESLNVAQQKVSQCDSADGYSAMLSLRFRNPASAESCTPDDENKHTLLAAVSQRVSRVRSSQPVRKRECEDRVLDGHASGERGSKGRNQRDCIREIRALTPLPRPLKEGRRRKGGRCRFRVQGFEGQDFRAWVGGSGGSGLGVPVVAGVSVPPPVVNS